MTEVGEGKYQNRLNKVMNSANCGLLKQGRENTYITIPKMLPLNQTKWLNFIAHSFIDLNEFPRFFIST